MGPRKSLLLLALPAVMLSACGGSGEDGVVAVVNGYKITAAELDRYYADETRDQSEPPSPEQARMLRLNLLSEVIDRQLLLQKAEALGLTAVDDEVDDRFEAFRAPFESDDAFAASLSDRGLSAGDFRAEIRRTLTIQKLFNREITSRVDVAEAELREYYEVNRASFAFAEQQLHLAQIVVTEQPESPVPNLRNDDATDAESAQAKITMLAERLASGEDFAELAENYSEDARTTPSGGDLGFIAQSQLENADIAVRRIVAGLSPGETSPVIETDGRYQIIRLIAKEPAGQRDFSDPRVQQQIRDTLLNRKDQLLKAAFMEVIRTEADIRNYFARSVIESYGLSD